MPLSIPNRNLHRRRNWPEIPRAAAAVFFFQLLFLPLNAVCTDFYVSPAGSSAGNGSSGSPWDLATAFADNTVGSNPNHVVNPGDTIYLRGGTYSGAFNSRLNGNSSSPITVKSYSGEWARIDLPPGTGSDTFLISGAWTYYRDFELFCSDPVQVRNRTYLQTNGPNNKFINLVIHDVGNNSFGGGNEIYGSILYNNGTDGSGLSHHLYTQNNDFANPAKITDNIIIYSYAFGIHAYATNGFLRGIQIKGNTLFSNGEAQSSGDSKDNIIVASVNTQPEQVVLQENYTWARGPADRNVSLGRYQSNNISIALRDNYFIGAVTFFNNWVSVEMTGNTFYSYQTGSIDKANFPSNVYLTSRPTVNKVVLRPNLYEAGRANISVYNWELKSSVAVDPSPVLNNGDSYVIRNAQNFFGPIVASGQYSGQPISLPMTGLSPAQPIGPGLIEPSEMTGTEFNVFVLTRSATGTLPAPSEPTGLKIIGN